MPPLIGLLGSNSAGNVFTAADGDTGNIEAVQLADSNGVQALFSADNADGTAVSATANKQTVVARNTRFNGTNWDREKKASASLSYRLASSAATTNAANVAAAPRDLFALHAQNTTAAIVYVHLYNTAGTPTAGTGIVKSFGIPANQSLCVTWAHGLNFSTGIGISLSTDAAGTAAVGAGAITAIGADMC